MLRIALTPKPRYILAKPSGIVLGLAGSGPVIESGQEHGMLCEQ